MQLTNTEAMRKLESIRESEIRALGAETALLQLLASLKVQEPQPGLLTAITLGERLLDSYHQLIESQRDAWAETFSTWEAAARPVSLTIVK